MAFRKFEEIGAWQESRKLMNNIRKFRKSAENAKDWSWSDQIGRSTLSIMANIAEGNDAASDTEFIRFLSYAKRSAAETRSHLYYGFDQKYLSETDFENTCVQAKVISAMISKLMTYLHRNNRKAQNRSIWDISLSPCNFSNFATLWLPRLCDLSTLRLCDSR